MSITDFGDPDQIIHIPARDLTGTREAKLAELDTLLAQLQMVRLVLCGRTPARLVERNSSSPDRSEVPTCAEAGGPRS